MEKVTIYMAHTTAHCHSGTLGRGLAAWPKPMAFGAAHASVRDQCTRSPPGVRPVRAARGSTAWWRDISNEVFGTAIPTTLTTRCYTHASMAATGEGFSPGQRWLGDDARRRSGQTAPNMDESSRARFLSCTSTPRALEALRWSLPEMRSDRESSHRWWAGVTRVICDGRRRSGPMIMKPGAKRP
jgi:hypothetical protein